MPKIVTTSELQKNIGKLLLWLGRASVIITNRGKASAVVLPYFSENDEAVAQYMEDYEMYRNAAALKTELRTSQESGRSNLAI
ncbi:MAG: hypothetical protein V1926_00320 [Candidatus Peregrinibacteria bacterium]